jgi:hypothetical protein
LPPCCAAAASRALDDAFHLAANQDPVFSPLREEQRYLARHGDAYRAYQQRVAYFVPSFRRP